MYEYRCDVLWKGSPSHTVFHIYYSHLNRWRITPAWLCLCFTLLSVSRSANHRTVSHKYFQSPRWKRFGLEMICLTLTRRVPGQTNAGRNCTTQSRMYTAKDSCGYLLSLSARSSTLEDACCGKLIYSFSFGQTGEVAGALCGGRGDCGREEEDGREEGAATPLEALRSLPLVVEDRVASALCRLFA